MKFAVVFYLLLCHRPALKCFLNSKNVARSYTVCLRSGKTENLQYTLYCLKKEINALKFCLRDDGSVPDAVIRELVATYGFDDKKFLRSQLTLLQKKELLFLKKELGNYLLILVI